MKCTHKLSIGRVLRRLVVANSKEAREAKRDSTSVVALHETMSKSSRKRAAEDSLIRFQPCRWDSD